MKVSLGFTIASAYVFSTLTTWGLLLVLGYPGDKAWAHWFILSTIPFAGLVMLLGFILKDRWMDLELEKKLNKLE